MGSAAGVGVDGGAGAVGAVSGLGRGVYVLPVTLDEGSGDCVGTFNVSCFTRFCSPTGCM